jgi:hypothetical protein
VAASAAISGDGLAYSGAETASSPPASTASSKSWESQKRSSAAAVGNVGRGLPGGQRVLVFTFLFLLLFIAVHHLSPRAKRAYRQVEVTATGPARRPCEATANVRS